MIDRQNHPMNLLVPYFYIYLTVETAIGCSGIQNDVFPTKSEKNFQKFLVSFLHCEPRLSSFLNSQNHKSTLALVLFLEVKFSIA